MAWREFGSGAPLVLLHGGHGSWLHWVRNIEALSQDHTLLIPDMPGYGDSGDPPSRAGEQERLMQIVDALIASLDQLLGAGASLALAVHEHSCLRTRFKSRLLSRTRQLPEALAAFSQPVLLIWGEHDVTATPMTLAHQLAELCAAGDWCVVPGAGHWVQYECAQTINPMLASWFGPGQRRYPV
ncbi:hypothetical protein IB257_26775 [Achromobacter sp. ACM03]|nr:hypothetical protein [Achromobacter sp. ACM03]